MAPRFDLTSTAPGQARIVIDGLAIPAKDKGLDLAVQRGSDEKYIGSGADWQNEPYWHRLEMLPDPANRSFRVGTDVVDALVQCYRADSFRASARWQGGQGDGSLRINGELMGSDARLSEPEPRPPTPPITDVPDARRRPGPGPIPVRPPLGETPDLPIWQRVPRRWALLAGVAGLGMAVVAAGALWLGAPPDGQVQTTADVPAETGTAPAPADPGTPQTPSVPDPAAEGAGQVTGTAATPAGPQETQTDGEKDLQIIRDPPPPNDQGAQTPGPGGSDSPSGGMTATEPAPAPYDAPQLKGPEYVSWLVDQAPDAATYQAQAERRASQGDCPAVILLYDRAARTNPEVAAQVARLYDPVGFQPSPCITQPSPNNAREYYELAAEGGVPAAQPALDALRTQGQPLPAIRTWENRQ